MKTITKTVNVYTFDELSNEAKERAINEYREKYNDSQVYFYELIESIKKAADVFGFSFGREYTDIRYSQIDNNILELSGVRLYKYIINNYGDVLFKPEYIKRIDKRVNYRQFICKVHKGKEGEFTLLYSKNKVTSSCVLIGVYYDDDILKPVYEFLKTPSDSVTFEDILKDIEHSIGKCFEDIENWVNSEEYIIEAIEDNGYEFTEDGGRY